MDEYNEQLLKEAVKGLPTHAQDEYRAIVSSLLTRAIDMDEFDERVSALTKKLFISFDEMANFYSYLFNATHSSGCMTTKIS